MVLGSICLATYAGSVWSKELFVGLYYALHPGDTPIPISIPVLHISDKLWRWSQAKQAVIMLPKSGPFKIGIIYKPNFWAAESIPLSNWNKCLVLHSKSFTNIHHGLRQNFFFLFVVLGIFALSLLFTSGWPVWPDWPVQNNPSHDWEKLQEPRAVYFRFWCI